MENGWEKRTQEPSKEARREGGQVEPRIGARPEAGVGIRREVRGCQLAGWVVCGREETWEEKASRRAWSTRREGLKRREEPMTGDWTRST